MLYEGVLLFGVLMTAGLLFSAVTDQRNAMLGRHGLQAFLFIVLGVYFAWFWSHGGQTVAMKTWNIRVLDRAGAPVSQLRAFARYVASWMWFAPALVALYFQEAHGLWGIFGTIVLGVLCYAAISRFHPSRQYWHDLVCGTQLVTQRPEPRRKKK
ncbi:RDD family protein [soil metagenome]